MGLKNVCGILWHAANVENLLAL